MTRPLARPETPQPGGGGPRRKLASPEPRENMEPRNPRVRWLVVFVLALVWMGAVFARLGYLQLFRYSEYLARAQRQQLRVRETTPKRGSIFDRNGHELAVSLPVDYCFADSSEINDNDMVAGLLSRVLNVAPEEIGARIEALNLRGIYVQKEPERVYPQRSLASQVIGYVNVDQQGQGGIEYELDKLIRGKPGRTLVTKDARRRGVDRSEVAAQPGSSVTLTIDENIQYIAEKELAAAM